MTSINIIGAGNVAHFLGISLTTAGHDIRCIYNRTISKANDLATLCGSMATDDLKALPSSELTIIAISDDHVCSIASEFIMHHGNDNSIVHTSGALGLDILPLTAKNRGCIWPLQSIKFDDNFEKKVIPLCVDASSTDFLNELFDIGKSISPIVEHLPSAKKKHAHVAAVIANNFTNHCLTLSEEYCTEHRINFDLLKPLIIESVQKIKTQSPKDIQTGPARRSDTKTIKKHLKLIEDKSLKKLYRRISKSIIKTYHEDH